MALLCAAITLISSLQADATTGVSHQPNRELMAQGVGNIATGLVGGNPGGASSATFINLQAGGRGRIAGIAAAAVVALALVVLPFSEIPLATLAGIVIVTGYRIIDWGYLRRLKGVPLGYTSVMLLTVTVAVLIGFAEALLVGLVVAALAEATRSHRRELEQLVSVPLLDSEIWPDAVSFDARVGLIVLPDWVSVASARELTRILGGEIKSSEAVILDFSGTTRLDDTSAALIGQIVVNKPVVIAGLHGEPAKMLAGFGNVRADRSVPDVDRAKAVIRAMVAR